MKRLVIFGSVSFHFLTSEIILMSVRLNLLPLKICFLLKYNHTDSDIMMIIDNSLYFCTVTTIVPYS